MRAVSFIWELYPVNASLFFIFCPFNSLTFRSICELTPPALARHLPLRGGAERSEAEGLKPPPVHYLVHLPGALFLCFFCKTLYKYVEICYNTCVTASYTGTERGVFSYGSYSIILPLRYGECSCLLHMQMVGRRWLIGNQPQVLAYPVHKRQSPYKLQLVRGHFSSSYGLSYHLPICILPLYYAYVNTFSKNKHPRQAFQSACGGFFVIQLLPLHRLAAVPLP